MPSVIRGSDDLDSGEVFEASAVVDVTGLEYGEFNIPSWATEVRIAFANVKSNSGLDWLMQLGGATAYEVANYQSAYFFLTGVNTGSTNSSTTGFFITNNAANEEKNGVATFIKLDDSTWAASYPISRDSGSGGSGTGRVTMSEPVTRFRVGVAGSTFSAGKLRATFR